MDRDAVLARLKSTEPKLRRCGVAGLYLYGSYSRGDRRPDSDVDLFVDKVPGEAFGFDQLMGSYRALCDALPEAEVSFGTREELSSYIRPFAEREAIRIF